MLSVDEEYAFKVTSIAIIRIKIFQEQLSEFWEFRCRFLRIYF